MKEGEKEVEIVYKRKIETVKKGIDRDRKYEECERGRERGR